MTPQDIAELAAEAAHDLWVEHKRAAGWTRGPKKDPEAKTHPCLLPWAQLPEHERAEDQLFGAVVRGVLSYYGVELSPKVGAGGVG